MVWLMSRFSMALTLVGALAFLPLRASALEVDLELAILVDVSGSIDSNEFILQRQGYVDAFNNAAVVTEIENGTIGSIAATLVYWSFADTQQQAVPWTQISDTATASAFAAAIAAAPRPFFGATAPGSAINFAVPLFEGNGFEGTRKLIDLSGDGVENDGANTATARDNALAAGIDSINGLVIGGSPTVLSFYENSVQGGPGSFTVEVATFAEFTDAINDKIFREIAAPPAVDPPATKSLEVVGGSSILPNRPTIVLTHGLQKENDKGDTDKLWTSFSDDPDKPGAGHLLGKLLGDDVNIIQYVWDDAFQITGILDGTDYIKAHQYLSDAGIALGALLLDELGDTYAMPIQFIGHSLGTPVNAYAAQLFLDQADNVTQAQFTILDYPNHIDANIPFCDAACENDFGIPDDFFASQLQDLQEELKLRDPVNGGLRIDNYYSLTGRGVGDRVRGRAYNHDAFDENDGINGLEDPNDIGGRLFEDEDFLGLGNNDHSGVHQWYRWTMDPNGFEKKTCKGDKFNPPKVLGFETFDKSLNPCQKGWYWSLFGDGVDQFQGLPSGAPLEIIDKPLELGLSLDFGCTITSTPDGSIITCAETSSPFIVVEVEIPEDANFLAFEYLFADTGDGDYVSVFLDDIAIWTLAGSNFFGSEFLDSGLIPLPGTGSRDLTIALFGVGDLNAEFLIRDFRTFSVASVIAVGLDIKPGRFPNSINRNNMGTIPVAILSAVDFDALTEVDEFSLTLGQTGDEDSLAFCAGGGEDINDDELPDLICHFDTLSTGFQQGDTEGILKGETMDGMPIAGADSVRIVGQ